MQDKFLDSYIETALWSSTDNDGIPLDSDKYVHAEFAADTLTIMRGDCESFVAKIDAEKLHYGQDDATFAHDFWLTRNRHGAGFWDGDYSKTQGEKLTNIAHGFGECDLYVGDDGKFYLA